MLNFIAKHAIFTLSFATFLDTIDNMFFTPDFKTYEHLTFFNDSGAFKLLVFGLYFGLVLASLCMFYNKHFLGGFVRTLDKNGCLSPESAMTLEELSYGKNFLIKLSLLHGYSLRRVVGHVAKDAENSTRVGGYSKKIDFNGDKFYLPVEKRDTAVTRFNEKGSGWVSVLLTALIGIVVVVIVFQIAPFIVELIDNSLSGFTPENDVLN